MKPEGTQIMSNSFIAIILAGGIRPAPLSNALGTPVLCLPVAHETTLLSAWLHRLTNIGSCRSVYVVVSSETDADAIRAVAQGIVDDGQTSCAPQVMVEPHRWRGTAGAVRDVAATVLSDDALVVVEAAVVPPSRAGRVLDTVSASAGAAIGIDTDSSPAGVYAFRPAVLEAIPSIGFYDIKEQLVPSLHVLGSAARVVTVTDRVVRIRDRTGYLAAVADFTEITHMSTTDAGSYPRVDPSASVVGHCIIDPSVVVERDVLVDSSVVLDDVVVRAGATISRSVIGSGVEIEPGALIVDGVKGTQLAAASPVAVP